MCGPDNGPAISSGDLIAIIHPVQQIHSTLSPLLRRPSLPYCRLSFSNRRQESYTESELHFDGVLPAEDVVRLEVLIQYVSPTPRLRLVYHLFHRTESWIQCRGEGIPLDA
jgi:hypothetical protein